MDPHVDVLHSENSWIRFRSTPALMHLEQFDRYPPVVVLGGKRNLEIYYFGIKRLPSVLDSCDINCKDAVDSVIWMNSLELTLLEFRR